NAPTDGSLPAPQGAATTRPQATVQLIHAVFPRCCGFGPFGARSRPTRSHRVTIRSCRAWTGSAAPPVIVGRSRLIVSPGAARKGGGAPGGRRVLSEVTQVTPPGARRLTAERAEYGVPQAATALHTFARIDRTGLIHDRSAGPQPRRLLRSTAASARKAP